jgi:tRNA (guanine-N7-)-methyltransferase
MVLGFKRIVSLARKRAHNPAKEARILNELLPRFSALTPEDGGMIRDLSEIFSGKIFTDYVVEIGFGSGENILVEAKNNPDLGYIGCEVFTGGVVKLLEGIAEQNIDNIRIWHDDALDLLVRIPANSLKLLYILYPDPWPKRRHNKRRLINPSLLSLLSSKLAQNGAVFIVTDHKDYAEHINESIAQVDELFFRQYDNYPAITKTKYRLKAESQGIESNYFYLKKK